jgi:hypothetical protein
MELFALQIRPISEEVNHYTNVDEESTLNRLPEVEETDSNDEVRHAASVAIDGIEIRSEAVGESGLLFESGVNGERVRCTGQLVVLTPLAVLARSVPTE